MRHNARQSDNNSSFTSHRSSGTQAKTTSPTTRTSSENDTSRFCKHFSVIQIITIAKSALTTLELNWNQRFWDNKIKLNICHHMRHPNNCKSRSFHVVERTRTSVKLLEMKNAHAKRAKLLVFTVKYAHFWRSCCRRRWGNLVPRVSLLCLP